MTQCHIVTIKKQTWVYKRGVLEMTKKEFDLIKEAINGCLKYENISPAVHLVCAFNRFELINNRVMEILFDCIRNGIYVTCSMYDELKEME